MIYVEVMKGFRKELKDNILRFWIDRVIDRQHGGFYGAIDGEGTLRPEANRGAVMYMRILWTFSAAYRVLGSAEYREVADRAFAYIQLHFVDKVFGGVYWELDFRGNPVNTKKQVYAQAFALYAFSEYYRATGVQEALDLSIRFFERIEACRDEHQGGYWEAFSREWQPIADMRLSEKDENEAKTMNTHLHILESYTNLLRIWPDARVVDAQKQLLHTFLDHIYDGDSGHLRLFFLADWQATGDAVSYGHDIEAAWLLLEAAEQLGDETLLQSVNKIALHIAEAAAEGRQDDGSIVYERKGEVLDRERHWWVQAEGVVGYSYAHRLQPEAGYDQYAAALWQYIRKELVDDEGGEWYWSRLEDGSVNRGEDKAGFWKCPYHNGRMCLELIEHFGLE